ncbi:c-type cytochrome biogenesis protein CcsB [Leekyejoonella antrihumi]|uniref:C-type cytochrome biogenesis protein CcsB n=1 Tax=Leekyejoonella antrihumi TaxID=1660198 RepID=A0A563DWW3_9MICO|nr:c-type cytochrome biogenesis protein CcsB [Leekyejoonella antrihumi]TWP34695.1 c-type cytochrome biogenesis protein CcsB [Leekyejoonella antrihumi]
MITAATDHVANAALNTASIHFLWSSAAVLTLAMLAFGIDLAGFPARDARAKEREAERAKALENSAVAQKVATGAGGGTAVLDSAPRPANPAEGGDAEEKRKWAGIGMSLSWLGGLLLVANVVFRAWSVDRPPLANMYEFAAVGTMFVMVAFLGWSLRKDVRWLGLFVVAPVVLVEMLCAVVFYTAASSVLPSLKSPWLMIHVTVATLSIALFTIAFSLTILYFIQLWREEKDEEWQAEGGARFRFMDSMPKSDVLDRTSYGVIILAFPLWTFTLIAGSIWAQKAWGSYWTWDPKEVWTLVIWVVYAAYLHARLTAGWTGKKAAYIALAGFACILVNYMIVNVFFVGMHSYSGM